jgi:hypothetical protein
MDKRLKHGIQTKMQLGRQEMDFPSGCATLPGIKDKKYAHPSHVCSAGIVQEGGLLWIMPLRQHSVKQEGQISDSH